MDVVSIQPVPYFAAFSSHPVDVQPQRNKRIKVSASLRSVETKPAEEKRRHVFQIPVKGLWSKKEEHEENSAKEGERKEMNKEEMIEKKRRKVNWAMQILRIGLIWQGEKRERPQEEQIADGVEQSDLCVGCCDGGEEGCDYAGDEVEIHKDSFSKLLRRVSLTEARLYERLSVLGNLAYRIPEIKEDGINPRYQKLFGKENCLHFVTSSLEKKLQSSTTKITNEKDDVVARRPTKEHKNMSSDTQKKNVRIKASTTYNILASAASYVQSHTQKVLPFGSHSTDTKSNPGKQVHENDDSGIARSGEASFVAATNTVTAVVAAKDEVKEAVANDLNTSRSAPCEWFICDDSSSRTRYFVIQGSGTLASWQANLLFEPIEFEGLGVYVHRGIYEAAKGIYEQMLAEVKSHLKSHGKFATLCFTGHSLGGSLSLLVNLMLLIRKEVPLSSLLPVVTFGSPTIMCGGNHLLEKLGLPLSHVQAITMHRDIVPRAFSCHYPHHVRQILKTINKNFRTHSCLIHQEMLYEPMGQVLILQPDEKISPYHHLLPFGSGLYVMMVESSQTESIVFSKRLLRRAKSVFFNSPHPLEILSDRSSYGAGGSITRDHDMGSYFRSIRQVIVVELIQIRKANKKHQRMKIWKYRNRRSQQMIDLSVFYEIGMGSIKKFRKVFVSKHVELLAVLMLPIQFLLSMVGQIAA
ncbi:putative Triacylglycerol lipase [Zostera marina]|uniref:Putative Triacylglycerol lipase n=1 Tax=Zostera marina TaxID=29655 RepID=A0A0K9P4M9_ZOSMR|nr:putative Triacylglycerol lipase [Zostera marina]